MKRRSTEIFDSLSGTLQGIQQSSQWHAEGDVWTHTLMVCEQLQAHPDFQSLTDRKQDLITGAARLHDIGKISTTMIMGDRIESPNHAPVGSRMARQRLWQTGICGSQELIRMRETVCNLIRYHSFPPHAIDSRDAVLKLHRIAANGLLLPDFTVRSLCLLAQADMLGRESDDKNLMMDNIELCLEMAREEGCLDACFQFPSFHTRHAFLSGKDIWKNQQLHDETWGSVYLMSGLPGSGKDTWIHRNLPDLPIISLDEIRKEMKIAPTDNQGAIANIGKERAKEFLRKHQPFVWNATNFTQKMRQQLISLFEAYSARVHIIYLETDWDTLLLRNASRADIVPRNVIEKMLGKLELPEIHEAHQVDWISV